MPRPVDDPILAYQAGGEVRGGFTSSGVFLPLGFCFFQNLFGAF